MKNTISTTILLSVLALSMPAWAAGDAMLELLRVLRDKGSLTRAEYELLYETATADSAASRAARAPMPPSAATGSEKLQAVASRTDRVRLRGDVRLRYQGQSADGDEDRGRGRFRYRLGLLAKPAQGWEVGAGLASGSSDLRSTNQSFDGAFSSKGINLDYAYAQYRLNDNLRAIAGKFKPDDYLYTVTDLMWDGDINPEGVSANLARPNRAGNLFANGGIWVLEENSASSDDPYMAYVQLGQSFTRGGLFGTIAGTWYSFRDINALGDIRTDGSNTDYRFEGVGSLAAEVGMTGLFGRGVKGSLIAEWVGNGDTVTSADSGYALGFKASRNAWSFKYIYADLEANAWPDILPDSDRFNGLTGIDGHEIAVGYALMKNVSLGLDYYNVDNTTGINQDLLQVDLSVKF